MLTLIIKYFLFTSGILYLLLILYKTYEQRHKVKNESGNIYWLGMAEIITWFLATFGVSDTALNMLFFRIKKTVDIKELPGTIIVSATVPMCFMSYAYIGNTSIDTVTLIVLVVSQAIGVYLGTKFVTKLNTEKIGFFMGVALLGSAFLIFVKQFLLNISGGNMIGLTTFPLVFTSIVFTILGALSIIGLGPTTINMSMLLFIGMNPTAVYPIVMTANAVGCIVGCANFINLGQYHRKASLSASVFGIFGVLVAVTVVKNMNLELLKILMILVLIYSAISLLYNSKTKSLSNNFSAKK